MKVLHGLSIFCNVVYPNKDVQSRMVYNGKLQARL